MATPSQVTGGQALTNLAYDDKIVCIIRLSPPGAGARGFLPPGGKLRREPVTQTINVSAMPAPDFIKGPHPKQSGIGRELGDKSLESFTELKSVFIRL
jgi:hypothetical protein